MMIEFMLNGTTHRVEPRPSETFLETLRERCGITSLKDGCSPQGQCGCCVALVDGLPKTTCAMPARVAEHSSAMGGSAWVEDRVGGGARFVVELPTRVTERRPSAVTA